MLQNMDIFVSDDISKTLSVHQNGRTVTKIAETAYCHLEEENNKFILYIPRDPHRREACFLIDLPRTLLKHLSAQIHTPGELASIISTKNLAVVDAILDAAGIIVLDGVERPRDEDGGQTPQVEHAAQPTSVTPPRNRIENDTPLRHLSPGRGFDYFHSRRTNKAISTNSC